MAQYRIVFSPLNLKLYIKCLLMKHGLTITFFFMNSKLCFCPHPFSPACFLSLLVFSLHRSLLLCYSAISVLCNNGMYSSFNIQFAVSLSWHWYYLHVLILTTDLVSQTASLLIQVWPHSTLYLPFNFKHYKWRHISHCVNYIRT